jgi:hypothetical protein
MSEPLEFDCIVCEKCMKPMQAKDYFAHDCMWTIMPDVITPTKKKWEVGIVANVKTEDKKKYLEVERDLENARDDLDGFLFELDMIGDKIRAKENEIANLENQLDSFESDGKEDNNV